MKILITFYSQSNNTKKVAMGIADEVRSQGHEIVIESIERVSPAAIDDFDLLFIGSACHDSDLAKPVKKFLASLPNSHHLKIAGFVTHATYTGEANSDEKEYYEQWAGKCVDTFNEISEEKQMDFLGFFHCLGCPTPEIATFINQAIVPDVDEFNKYMTHVANHPDENDILNAQAFASDVLLKY